MKSMGTETAGDACPFAFNFEASTFQAGDYVSYRIPEELGDFPFVGILLAVFHDYVEISPNDPTMPDKRMRGTRESRPVVAPGEAF